MCSPAAAPAAHGAPQRRDQCYRCFQRSAAFTIAGRKTWAGIPPSESPGTSSAGRFGTVHGQSHGAAGTTQADRSCERRGRHLSARCPRGRAGVAQDLFLRASCSGGHCATNVAGGQPTSPRSQFIAETADLHHGDATARTPGDTARKTHGDGWSGLPPRPAGLASGNKTQGRSSKPQYWVHADHVRHGCQAFLVGRRKRAVANRLPGMARDHPIAR